MKLRRLLAVLLAVLIVLPTLGSAHAQTPTELRLVWYNDGNEGEVLRDLLDRFEKENTDIKVVMDTLPYADLHTTLQTQVDAGTPPDMARVNDVARFAGKYLELSGLVKDAKYYTDNFPGAVLQSLRKGDDTTGLYGFPLQFSVTVPFVNATLFEQAGVPLLDEKATWAEWIDAAAKVAKATETPYAIAIDRTGHRFWGYSLVQGATYILPDGNFKIDTPGFRKAAQDLMDWHASGLAPKDVWAGSGGGYVAAADYFINGRVVLYYAGTWQIQNFSNNIGDKFDWKLIPNPTGPAASTGVPGGSLFVAFEGGTHKQESARVIDYLTSEPVLEEFLTRTLFIPGHLGLASKGITYPTNNEALKTALAEVPKITPEAYALQYSPFTFVLNPAIRDALSQVIAGEITLDQAIVQIQEKIDQAVADSKKSS